MKVYAEQRFGKAFFDSIIEWIAEELDIDEVFSKRKIERWLIFYAKDYGYVKEDEE